MRNSIKRIVCFLISLTLGLSLYSNFSNNINVCAQNLATGFIQIATGGTHTLALKNDGTVWAWGRNNCGQLGDGTKVDRLTPVQVKGLTNVKRISSGLSHSIALKNDGTIWGWGANSSGQLGDGSKTDRTIPVQAIGLNNIENIDTKTSSSIALKNDGTVWAWGSNNCGQLGDGSKTDRIIPIQVAGLTDVKAISSGYYHNIALSNDGKIWAWGRNQFGQLGDGTTTDRMTPVQVAELINVRAISSGHDHNMALSNDGKVWTWGYNSFSQLGDGTIINRSTPIQVIGLTNICEISSGYCHNMALSDDGTVWAWGSNNYGQLGDGTTTNKSIPVQVAGLTDIKTIFTKFSFSMVEKVDGTIWAWGINTCGQLGDGTIESKYTPIQIVALNSTYYPEQPHNLKATPDSGQIFLSWDNASNAITYSVKRATTPDGDYIICADDITETNYIDTSVTNGITYYYIVNALNNGLSSANSIEVSATPEAAISIPEAPTNVSATEKDQSVDISWNSVTGAESYVVKRSTTSGSGYTTVASDITEIAYTDTGLTNGTTYYYVVVAKNAAGESGNSTEVLAIPEAAISIPEAPTNVSATGKDQGVDLSWDSVTGTDSYIVKRSTTSGSGYITVASDITETTYTDTGLTNGTTYYYVVTAKNTVGESVNSTEVSAVPEVATTAPEAPTNVTATEKDQSIDLSWNSVTGAESYIVKRSTTSGSGYATIASDITETTYTDTGLTNGTTYYYVVIAKNATGESNNSTEVSAFPVNNPPAIPTGLAVENSDKSVKLSWGDTQFAHTYTVKRGTTSGGPYTLVADNINTPTYTDTGLTNGTTYYYVVSAVNSIAESQNSNEVIAKPDLTKPNPPTTINVTEGYKSIALTWDKIHNADSYIIKKATTSGGPYTLVAENLTTTAYTDTGLTNGTSYFYIIIAKNEKGESETSQEVAAIPGIPKPTNVITQVVDKGIRISWDLVDSADGYNIKRSDALEGPYTLLSEGITGTDYTDENVVENKIYYYVITSVNNLGESQETEPVSAIIKNTVGKRYILLIALTNGMQKEYDVDSSTAAKFISWYTNRANGVGIPFFTLFNDEKDIVYKNSKDYIGFNSILFYQLNEYEVHTQE